MKLAVSNIAWTNEEEAEVAKLLQQLGVKYIEVAPTKLWEDPTKASDKEIKEYQAFWQAHGIEVVAFQSMLFTRPDLKLFESEANRQATLQYLQDFTALASKMGAKVLVFGSPKNRQRGELPLAEAKTIAAEFFTGLGDTAKQNGVSFCIEPNATDYACDFVTNAAEGIELVRKVNNPGFGLHLDIACMTLAHDNIEQSIQEAADITRHFHISSPMLEAVEPDTAVDHQAAAKALKAINYDGFVSIEMKPQADGKTLERVERAVRFAQEIYR